MSESSIFNGIITGELSVKEFCKIYGYSEDDVLENCLLILKKRNQPVPSHLQKNQSSRVTNSDEQTIIYQVDESRERILSDPQIIQELKLDLGRLSILKEDAIANAKIRDFLAIVKTFGITIATLSDLKEETELDTQVKKANTLVDYFSSQELLDSFPGLEDHIRKFLIKLEADQN